MLRSHAEHLIPIKALSMHAQKLHRYRTDVTRRRIVKITTTQEYLVFEIYKYRRGQHRPLLIHQYTSRESVKLLSYFDRDKIHFSLTDPDHIVSARGAFL